MLTILVLLFKWLAIWTLISLTVVVGGACLVVYWLAGDRQDPL